MPPLRRSKSSEKPFNAGRLSYPSESPIGSLDPRSPQLVRRDPSGSLLLNRFPDFRQSTQADSIDSAS